MCIVDANVVLRYILNDHPKLSPIAAEVLENHRAILVTEVMCEIVYVLQKVYNVPSREK
ncbi:MAG: twitching motility protein PilT [Desulfobacterales bacterium]|nr:twitching motility protein PilT [Desulfobacterales bacterium]